MEVTETQGHPVFYGFKGLSLELWLKPTINAVRFASQEIRQVHPDLQIIRVRPIMSSEAVMVVWG